MDQLEQLQYHYREILKIIGEDVEREGLLKTPERAAKSILDLTKGYSMDPKSIIEKAKFVEDYKNMVIIKDIKFYSLCEHHILPFYGKVHVGYMPNGQIVGLSKIPRVVDVFSHRLQVQERMTHELVEALQEHLNPLGVIVVIEAQHMCMQMRGVEKDDSVTTTIDFSGVFSDLELRQEFLRLIKS
jgi:GTP cyclohydrolase I